MVVKFSAPPEFDLSKKLILVKAPPKGTCPRNLCEIPGGGNKFVDHGKAYFKLSLKASVKEIPQYRDFFENISKSPAQGPHTGEL